MCVFSGQSELYLGCVVHHDVSAAHSFGPFAGWDAQMIAAAVAHGQKAACAPSLVWEDAGELYKHVEVTQSLTTNCS